TASHGRHAGPRQLGTKREAEFVQSVERCLETRNIQLGLFSVRVHDDDDDGDEEEEEEEVEEVEVEEEREEEEEEVEMEEEECFTVAPESRRSRASVQRPASKRAAAAYVTLPPRESEAGWRSPPPPLHRHLRDMKQWRKLLLAALLAWLLLFLSLLSHFLDGGPEAMAVARASRSPVAGLTRTEIRRLTSIQGGGGKGPSSRALGGPDASQGSALQEEEEVREVAPGRRRKVEQQWREKRRTWVAWRQRGGANASSLSKAAVRRLWQGRASSRLLSPRLQQARQDYLNVNKHRVADRAGRGRSPDQRRRRRSAPELLCELRSEARLRTLDGSQQPFAGMGWSRVVPRRPLAPAGTGAEFDTCAVVMSAGAMLNSSLGKEIDSHDAVLRFNAAPTEGYERDILARPLHHFNSSSLYRDVTLVAWDPAPYSVDLSKWYENPDYDLFTPYVERRRRRPDQPFYILHPAYIWRLWDVIQANAQESIQPNPPSSGFIVRRWRWRRRGGVGGSGGGGGRVVGGAVVEPHQRGLGRQGGGAGVVGATVLPAVEQHQEAPTDLCHYYEQQYDAACTLGAYHPLLYEKLLVLRMNAAPRHDSKVKGRVTLPGFGTVDCAATAASV
ncbi:hypothetical protein CRUP_013549, partial [Coryphaenoides rupestris]